MAGHSKWKNIKHKKAAADAQKAKKFTKLLKEITMAAKAHGGDLSANPHLRTLIEKAHEINMPKDNYQRAIKRGTGEIEGNHYERHIYEGYGPGSIAVVVEVLSDNKNRAASEIRRVFSHNGGHIAEPGAVMWMFDKKGIIQANVGATEEEDLMDMLSTYNIDDMSLYTGTAEIVCEVKDFQSVISSLKHHGCSIDEAEIGYHPKTTVELSDEDHIKAVEFLEKLDELEDVQNIYANIK